MKAVFLLPLAVLVACAPTIDNRQWEAKRNIVALGGAIAQGPRAQVRLDCTVANASYVELTEIIAASTPRQMESVVAQVRARPAYSDCVRFHAPAAAG